VSYSKENCQALFTWLKKKFRKAVTANPLQISETGKLWHGSELESPGCTSFSVRSIHVGSLALHVSLDEVFLQALRISPHIIIPTTLLQILYRFQKQESCGMAQNSSFQVVPDSVSGQFMWDLWHSTYHWMRFFFKHLGLPLTLSFQQRSIPIRCLSPTPVYRNFSNLQHY